MTLEADRSAEMFSAEADTGSRKQSSRDSIVQTSFFIVFSPFFFEESFLYCQYIISGKPLSRGENAEQGGRAGARKRL